MTQYRILKPGEIAVPGDECKHRGHWWRVNNEFTILNKHLPIRRPASPEEIVAEHRYDLSVIAGKLSRLDKKAEQLQSRLQEISCLIALG